MKNPKHILLLFLVGLCLQSFGKGNILVKQMALIDRHRVQMPFMLDSTDVNGSTFKASQLMNAFVPPTNSVHSKFSVENADTAGIFNLAKPQHNMELCYMEFRVYASRFVKSKLLVSSTTDFTVYVNGEKKEGSVGNELALPNGSGKIIELTMIPQYYTIGVCCQLNSKAQNAPALKVALAGDTTHLALVPPGDTSLRKLSYEDIINVAAPYETSISYKSTYVLNKVSTVLPGGEKLYLMELIDRASGKRLMQTSEHLDAAWMPKTEKLYYIEKQAAVRIMKMLDPVTLEVTQVAKNIPDGNISWSPDEKYLIITSTDKYKEPTSDIKYYNQPKDRIGGWRNTSYLSKFDITTGQVQQLTFGNCDISLHDIALDGSKLIFSMSKHKVSERPFNFSSFYQYNFATDKIDSIWLDVPYISNVSYSPDCNQLLVLAAPAAFNKLGENMGKHAYSNNYDVQAYLYDFTSKKATALTRDFSPTIAQGMWSLTDKCLFFKVTDRDYERVYRYSLDTKKFDMLPLKCDYVQQFDLSGNGLYATYRGMAASYPGRAFVLNLKTGESTMISDPEKEKMAGIALGKVQDFSYKARDGVTIYGRYYTPSDFDASKKYPMIVYYYGGTTPTQRTFSSNWNFHFWASMGYVVYVVQPSGTIGFGQEFSARHVNAWGDRTADDIIQGVRNFCAANSFIDTKKIGCLGASYGGFMTMYLQTKTDIFATAISHAGISALSSYWGDGYWGYEYSGVATADTYPWNNPKFYTDHSPLFRADKIKTPLLLIQGEVDTNVPVGESTQMFTAMKILGKNVEMIRVKNEDHIIMDYQHRKDWNYSIMAWMARYLQNDGTWWENLYPDSKKN